MDSRGSDSEPHRHSSASISHFIHTVKKLTLYHAQRDVGTESDCGVDGGICTAVINLYLIMDPVVILLLFNVAVWCYWTIK